MWGVEASRKCAALTWENFPQVVWYYGSRLLLIVLGFVLGWIAP